MSVTPPNSAVSPHRFRRRLSVWMTYGDGRHCVSPIDDLRTLLLRLTMTRTPFGQNYFA
jgi:hypothetical protein